MRKRKPIPQRLLIRSRELRQEATSAEETLWEHLRGRQLNGAKFRRQVVIGRYIVDFYCHDSHLIIELDGSAHDAPGVQGYDTARQADLEAQGYAVLRFRNEDVEKKLANVLNIIEDHLQAATPPLPKGEGYSPASPGVGG